MGALTGRIALVTGGGSVADAISIGRAIAVRFAREGAFVGVVDVDVDRARNTVSGVEAEGGVAEAIVADVTVEEQCERAVAAIVGRWGRLDVLVNGVGIVPKVNRIEGMDVDEWDHVMAVNVRSAALMAKAAIPHMTGGGAVVSISSISGLRASGAGAYGPSKAALIALARELAVSFGPRGIRSNSIAPGHMYTPLVAGTLSPEARERRRRIAPLQIEGDAWDVAAAALFLASDESRFVNGVCLPVDGGVTATSALSASAFVS